MDWRDWYTGTDGPSDFERSLSFCKNGQTVNELLDGPETRLPLLVRVNEGFYHPRIETHVKVGELLLVVNIVKQSRVVAEDSRSQLTVTLPASRNILLQEVRGDVQMSLSELNKYKKLPFRGAVVKTDKDCSEVAKAKERRVARPGDILNVLRGFSERVLVTRRVSLDWPMVSERVVYVTEGTPLVFHECIQLKTTRSLKWTLSSFLEKAQKIQEKIYTDLINVPEEVSFHRQRETVLRRNNLGKMVIDVFHMVEFAPVFPISERKEQWIELLTRPIPQTTTQATTSASVVAKDTAPALPPRKPLSPTVSFSGEKPLKLNASELLTSSVQKKKVTQQAVGTTGLPETQTATDLFNALPKLPSFSPSSTDGEQFVKEKVSAMKSVTVLLQPRLYKTSNSDESSVLNPDVEKVQKKKSGEDETSVKVMSAKLENSKSKLEFQSTQSKNKVKELLTGTLKMLNRKKPKALQSAKLTAAVPNSFLSNTDYTHDDEEDYESIDDQLVDSIADPRTVQSGSETQMPEEIVDKYENLVGTSRKNIYQNTQSSTETKETPSVKAFTDTPLNKVDIQKNEIFQHEFSQNGYSPLHTVPSSVQFAEGRRKYFDGIQEVPIEREQFAKLSIKEVGRCLELYNMKKYVQAFQDNYVDGTMLLSCSEDMLMKRFNMDKFNATRLILFINGHRPV